MIIIPQLKQGLNYLGYIPNFALDVLWELGRSMWKDLNEGINYMALIVVFILLKTAIG